MKYSKRIKLSIIGLLFAGTIANADDMVKAYQNYSPVNAVRI